MLQKTTYQNIISLIQEDFVLEGFKYYQNKYSDLLYLKYKKDAVFAFTKNKNDVYEGQAYFIKIENANEIILALKQYLNSPAIPYVLNKNRKEIFDKIEEQNLHLKMHKYVLNQKLNPFQNSYEIINAENTENLLNFYIDCFENEFDENAKIWLRDFDQMEQQLVKGNKQIKINGEIAASLMYWIMEDSIFIFLLGTHPDYRRKKLAFILIQHLQDLFPNKQLSLSTWAETNTEKFYLNIGFEKMQLAHICI